MNESCVRVRERRALAEPHNGFVASPLSPGPWCGRTLGRRYRLIEPIGFGGSGVVFVARDRIRRERVAVKVSPLEPPGHAWYEWLPVHAQVELTLVHPHLVELRDAG